MKKLLFVIATMMLMATVGCVGKSDASDTGSQTEENKQTQTANAEETPVTEPANESDNSSSLTLEPGVTGKNEFLLNVSGQYEIYADTVSWNIRYVDTVTKTFSVIPYSQVTNEQIDVYNETLIPMGYKMPRKDDTFVPIPVEENQE